MIPSELVFEPNGISIYGDEIHLLDIRGWGYFTGLKGMSEQQAIDEQVEFGQELVNRYNQHEALKKQVEIVEDITRKYNDQMVELGEAKELMEGMAELCKEVSSAACYGKAGKHAGELLEMHIRWSKLIAKWEEQNAGS